MISMQVNGSCKAGDVVQMILDHGKLRPPEILTHLQIFEPKGKLSGLSPWNPDLRLATAIAVYTQAIHKLVSASYLKPSTILSHISPRDKRIQYEAEEKAKISGFPMAKELREAKEVAEARLRREEEEAEKVGLVSSMCIWLELWRNLQS